jgi:hypothetical protein
MYISQSSPLKLKLHLFDLLWICGTTSCTTNPQQIETVENGFRLVHNKSKSCTTNPQLYDKSPANPQQIEQVESELDEAKMIVFSIVSSRLDYAN